MSQCNLSYIPERLHQNNNPSIDFFEIGEFLFRRCTKEEIDNPYKSISIVDLSHNRGGIIKNRLCNPDDILFSVKEEESFEKYENKVICTLTIRSLNENNQYIKEFSEVKNEKNCICILELLHEPIPCMYPHCVFRVVLNNQIITYENYKNTIQKHNQIRNQLKEELASMIVRRQISQYDTPTNILNQEESF